MKHCNFRHDAFSGRQGALLMMFPCVQNKLRKQLDDLIAQRSDALHGAYNITRLQERTMARSTITLSRACVHRKWFESRAKLYDGKQTGGDDDSSEVTDGDGD